MDHPEIQMMRDGVCEKTSLRKGTWSPEEDQKLIDYVHRYGIWNWAQMPKPAGLLRSGKSCRLRWMNYLKPGVKRGNFTQEEDEIIFKLHEQLGNRWSTIASRLPGRTDNEIKNYWHTRMKKRLKNKQVLPQTATIKNNQKNPSEDFSSMSSQPYIEDFPSSSSDTSDEIYERQTKSENIGSSEKYGKLQSSAGQTFPILESFGMVEGNGTTDPGFVVPTSPVVISDEQLQSLLEQTVLPMEGLDMVEGAGATDTGFIVSNSQGRFSDEELQALLDQPFPIETSLDLVEGYAATDPGFMVSTSQEWGLQEDTYRCASYYDGGNDFWPYFLMEP